nr:helix-turn-helix transcriptional regulator [Kibdelosporangium phytohabitans]
MRRRLGAKARRMREEAGLTLSEAADLLDKTKSALHRVETGETRLDVHLARSMMDKYDIYDPKLVDDAREAAKTPWYRAFGVEDMGYVDVETSAARVNEFSVLLVPGLLQTDAYMDAVFSSGHSQDPARMESQHKIRRIRQARLTDEERPLKIHAVLDEAALHREVGGAVVMREQLLHLIAVAARPAVTLRILPFDRGAHRSLMGSFTVLEFPDPSDPPMLYVEFPMGSLHIEDVEKVGEAKLRFEQLRRTALNLAYSVELLERLAVELYGA